MPRRSKEPEIKQHNNGIYYLYWTPDGDGRRLRRSCGTADYAKALQVLTGFIEGNKEATDRKTIAGILSHYWQEHVLRKVSDKDRALQIITLLKHQFGTLDPNEINSKVINHFVDRRISGEISGNKVKTSSVRRELGLLVAALNLARKDGWIKNVPHVPLPPMTPPKDVWLTEEQCDQWLAACDPEGKGTRMFRFSLLKLRTAARARAVLNLKWEHVDLERGTIDFRSTIGTVTKKKRVVVPISDSLRPFLLKWKEQDEPQQDDYVIGSNRGYWAQWRRVRERLVKATDDDMWDSVTPYTLRHTWATLAAVRGVRMEEIAAILGDSISTVYKNYIHHNPDHLRGAMR